MLHTLQMYPDEQGRKGILLVEYRWCSRRGLLTTEAVTYLLHALVLAVMQVTWQEKGAVLHSPQVHPLCGCAWPCHNLCK